jgi:hypothetical protein
VFGDLYGNIWMLDPANHGNSVYTTATTPASSQPPKTSTVYINTTASGSLTANYVASTGVPLFQWSEDYHPFGAAPAIYNNGGTMYAVLADGGYADVSGNTGWGNNLAAGKFHYALAVSLNSPAADATINESKASDVLFKFALGAGEKAYSQVTVVGTQVFIASDSSTVNAATYGTGGATGHVYRYDTATAAQGTVVAVQGGAGSVANIGSTLYASSSNEQQKLTTAALTNVGPTVTATILNSLKKQLWIRTE